MNPLERVANTLSKIPGLNVFLYNYVGTQAMQTPTAICNYVSFRSTGVIGKAIRLTFGVRVIVVCSKNDNPSQLLMDIITAAINDPHITEVEGGSSNSIGGEIQFKNAPQNAIILDLTMVARKT